MSKEYTTHDAARDEARCDEIRLNRQIAIEESGTDYSWLEIGP